MWHHSFVRIKLGAVRRTSEDWMNGGRPRPRYKVLVVSSLQISSDLQICPKSKKREYLRKVLHFTQPSTVASVKSSKMLDGSSTKLFVPSKVTTRFVGA